MKIIYLIILIFIGLHGYSQMNPLKDSSDKYLAFYADSLLHLLKIEERYKPSVDLWWSQCEVAIKKYNSSKTKQDSLYYYKRVSYTAIQFHYYADKYLKELKSFTDSSKYKP